MVHAVSKTFTKQLGDRVRARRLLLGHTQEQLAKLVGLGVQQIAMYESGRANPPADTLLRLARALDTSSDWIIGRGEKTGQDEQHKLLIDPSVAAILRRLHSMTKPERKRIHALIIAAAGSGE